MRRTSVRTVASALAWLLLWSCKGEFVVGENTCYGTSVRCGSDVPALYAFEDTAAQVTHFDVTATQLVKPAWVYDIQCGSCSLLQMAPAYGGGVWLTVDDDHFALHRIDAKGETADLQPLPYLGILSVDEQLDAVVAGYPGYVRVNGRGELSEYHLPAIERRAIALIPGPDGHVRVSALEKRKSYVAEYDGGGELVWKQSDLQVPDYAFDPEPAGYSANIFKLILLRDGSLAAFLPMDGTPISKRTSLAGLDRGHGVTLLEADGNVRWRMYLGPSDTLASGGVNVGPGLPAPLVAPGADGGLVMAFASSGALILVVDRAGNITARWAARRVDYYEDIVDFLATDSAGDIYTAGLSGPRDAPLVTVCRISASEPSADPVCLGVDDLRLTNDDGILSGTIKNLVAPEPGSVVLSLESYGSVAAMDSVRLVRVEF
jgi:hypothetical protein